MSTAPLAQLDGSPRVRLARVALEAALATPGVLGTDAGVHGLCMTEEPTGTLLRGVSVIAQADGRYEVELSLVAQITPLLALGEDIRARVQARAAREQLNSHLGAVRINFAHVLSAREILEQAAREREVAAVAWATQSGEPAFPEPPAPALAPMSSAPLDDEQLP